MMLEILDRLDARTAAGVLAKAALRLNYQWHPFPEGHLIEGQSRIEVAVLEELRRSLNLTPDDLSERARELLTEALDNYSERLILSVDGAVSIDDLNAKGLMPSDTLELNFSEDFDSMFGVSANVERRIAELTVKHPHREERVPSIEDHSQEVASLYSRYFRHQYPAREFWLIVVIYAIGSRTNVSDVWRLYPADLDLSHCENLVDAIRVFSGKFGVPIEIDGTKGSFFFSVRKSALNGIGQRVTILRQTSPDYRKHNLRLSMFAKADSKSEFVQLLKIIDVTRYYEAVSKRHGWDKNIMSQLIKEDRELDRIRIAGES